jgi:hypothetical protein
MHTGRAPETSSDSGPTFTDVHTETARILRPEFMPAVRASESDWVILGVSGRGLHRGLS